MPCFFRLSCLLVVHFFFFVANSQTPLNEMRIIASHNSYKKCPHKKVLRFLNRYKKKLGPENDPIQIDYGHESLSIQLDSFHVRGFELDIYNDPKGGHFRKRAINRYICGRRTKAKDKRFKEPGFKILHIPDVDFETNYVSLRESFQELNEWSQNHANHHPIFINIECKNSSPGDQSKALRRLGFKKCIPFDSSAYQNLDKEILSNFNRSQIFTPNDLKGSFSNIYSRLDSIGWPTVESLAGKFIFILDGYYSEYSKYSSERILFHYGSQSDLNTAFLIRNNSLGIEKNIRLLSKHFIIRTRADAGTYQSRNNDYERFNSALDSGAQIISTDYYKPDLRWSNYKVSIEP